MQEWLSHIPTIDLDEPLWLLLLPVLLLAFFYVRWRQKKGNSPVMLFPGLEKLRAAGFEAGLFVRTLPRWLRWASLVIMVFALAGPRIIYRQTEAESNGIDIMLALDISESMLQKDFSGESRLDAAKEVTRKFVLRRTNDRIGLVVFRGKGYTQCPLTLDHEVLAMLLDRVSPRVIQDDGTAIGTAILIALNRLRVSDSAQRVIILVTDGENNTGEVWPSTAAELAAHNGVRIYTVNAAKPVAGDTAPVHRVTDDETLQAIARMTGGGYYRAEDPGALQKTIAAIDQLEKKRYSGHLVERHTSMFFQLVFSSLALLILDVLLSNTRLLRIP
ncbi:MAG: VWA domain-containing protein [Chlorobium sp.]|nr:MAG: VWA domain-containing protein [Chlorobium sp.]